MNKWTEILVGLVLIIGTILLSAYSGVWGGPRWDFLSAAWIVFKGGLAWFVFLIGLLFLMLGISDLKN